MRGNLLCDYGGEQEEQQLQTARFIFISRPPPSKVLLFLLFFTMGRLKDAADGTLAMGDAFVFYPTRIHQRVGG